MSKVIVRRIISRFDWDRPGVCLAALLFLGECVAVVLAGISLLVQGYDGGRLAALLGAAVLAIYVPLAIWQGKLPFAGPTEYEKRRTYAQRKLGVKIPRTGDLMKGGGQLGSEQVDLGDGSEGSIRAAVGRAYCLGNSAFENSCSRQWPEDVKQWVQHAQLTLVPPVAHLYGISGPPEVMPVLPRAT